MVNGALIFSFALAQFSSEVVKLVDTSTPQGPGVCFGGGSVINDCASVGGRNFVGKRFFRCRFWGGDRTLPTIVAPAQAGAASGLAGVAA